MKSLLILSILLRGAFFSLLVFQLYLKNASMDIVERYVNIFMSAFGLVAFFFPITIWMYIIQMAHCGYLIYSAVQLKHKEMTDIKEDEAKDLFMTFFVFFSAMFHDGQFHANLFHKIIYQFKYFILNILNIILLALALFLACVYDGILKGRIEVYPKAKEANQKSSSIECSKEKVD